MLYDGMGLLYDLDKQLKEDNGTPEERIRIIKEISEYDKHKGECLLKNQAVYSKKYLLKILEEVKYEDSLFRDDLQRHKAYKALYWIGVILWMTSVFWGPILIGTIYSCITDDISVLPSKFNNNIGLYHLSTGIEWMLVFMFTTPITLPLSFAIGVFVHPYLLKKIIFNKEHPYCEELMKTLKLSKGNERTNAAAVTASMFIGKK